MKYRFRVLLGIFSLLLVISVGFNIVLATSGDTPEPGSDQDPLVSKSYVDAQVAAKQQLIQQLQDEVAALKGSQGGSDAKGFEAVSVAAGKAIYPGAGAEIILRSGSATALKGNEGGLADTTAAKDLSAGASVALNHLLICARNDGRGMKAAGTCWVMIRGSYTIGQPPASTTPSTPATTTQKGTVNTATLNVRAQASTSSTISAKLVKGDVVDILGKSGDWYKIKTSKGVTGYAASQYITVN